MRTYAAEAAAAFAVTLVQTNTAPTSEPPRPQALRVDRVKAPSGKTKVRVCQLLGDYWEDIANWFEIPLSDRRRFQHGREPERVWEWLEVRDKINELKDALVELKLGHIADELL